MALVSREADKLPKLNPLERPDYIEADVQALRALAIGNATPDQQKRCLAFLVNDVCCTYDMPFRPENQSHTAFACGKQWVGQALVWLLQRAPTKTSPDEQAARRAMEGEQA